MSSLSHLANGLTHGPGDNKPQKLDPAGQKLTLLKIIFPQSISSVGKERNNRRSLRSRYLFAQQHSRFLGGKVRPEQHDIMKSKFESSSNATGEAGTLDLPFDAQV